MKKTILKWLLLCALFAYALIIGTWAMARAAQGRVSGIEIEVTGDIRNDSVIRQGIVDQLMRYDKTLINKPIADFNLRKLETYLQGFSNFEEVECCITSGNKLRIVVTPMIPEIRVFDGDKSYYINKDGKYISANAEFFSDVPIVTGHFTKQMPPQIVLPVVRYIQRDSLLRHLVSMVEVRDANNIILIPRIRGAVINLGDTNNLPYKRRSIEAAYKQILPRRGWETYDTISVKYHGQIVATRRNKDLPQHSVDFGEEEDLEEATLPDVTADNNSPD